LYRLSGQKVKIQTIYNTFLEKQRLGHLDEEDIGTVTGLLKYGLQSLHEPLLTFALYDNFMDTARMSNRLNAPCC
jgi:hypothetical protein